MQDEQSGEKAMPSLLTTQLLASEVYSHFMLVSSGEEKELWRKMLLDELDHVAHIGGLLRMELPETLRFPFINVERVREACRYAETNREFFLMRLEGALRLESAELDYGLEGMVARKLEQSDILPGYPGDIRQHLSTLIDEAKRYAEAPNIGLNLTKLIELLDTCLSGTTRIWKDNDSRRTLLKP